MSRTGPCTHAVVEHWELLYVHNTMTKMNVFDHRPTSYKSGLGLGLVMDKMKSNFDPEWPCAEGNPFVTRGGAFNNTYKT